MLASEVARRVVLRALRSLGGGRVEIRDDGRAFAFGNPEAELCATVEVHDRRAYARSLRGSVGWGESYVAGEWDTDDLVSLTRIACRNLEGVDRWRRRLHPAVGPVQRTLERVPRNTRSGAAANISAHYDLGNELFASFLDRRMIYSCALFERPGIDLDEAQEAKLERICERLELDSGDHLVELGTGWGALAVYAADQYGCRVTTTTISREQHAYASRLVAEEGLDDRVAVLLRDYRDLEGTYDKLVSIEMIEAVGWQYFPTFFERCAALLRAGGRMFLQAITIADHLYEQEKAARSFTNKHVFPGGCLPSQELITRLSGEVGLTVARCEEITPSYPHTLAAWRERFNAAWSRLRTRGYDERFRRLWNFYLATSEAGFRERRIRDLQFTLDKPGTAPASSRAPAEALATA